MYCLGLVRARFRQVRNSVLMFSIFWVFRLFLYDIIPFFVCEIIGCLFFVHLTAVVLFAIDK